MFVDGGEGGEIEASGDFFVGRRVAVSGGEAGEEVDNFFLPPRNRHANILANERRIASEIKEESEEYMADPFWDGQKGSSDLGNKKIWE